MSGEALARATETLWSPIGPMMWDEGGAIRTLGAVELLASAASLIAWSVERKREGTPASAPLGVLGFQRRVGRCVASASNCVLCANRCSWLPTQ